MGHEKMKKHLKKYYLVFLSLCICLILVSTATAVPVYNKISFNNENNQNHPLEKHVTNFLLEHKTNLLNSIIKNIEENSLNKIDDINYIEELSILLESLSVKDGFTKLIAILIYIILSIIFYIPGLIVAIILNYVLWTILMSSLILYLIRDIGPISPDQRIILVLLLVGFILGFIPATLCLPLILFYPLIIIWMILNGTDNKIKKSYFKDFQPLFVFSLLNTKNFENSI